MHITGESDGPPVKVGVAITDITTGLFAHGAIMAALFARSRTNVGQKIDVSLLECQVAALANVAHAYLIGGIEARRWGTQHASIVPYQVCGHDHGGRTFFFL
jgi:succinate--hydroxymethylglutarate CoA-transferase